MLKPLLFAAASVAAVVLSAYAITAYLLHDAFKALR